MTTTLDHLATAFAGRYRIERELGRGGMATVWLAADLKHGRPVAIKVLHPHLVAVVGAERFLKEIRTTANLQHPHILALHDSGEADGLLFYVMPFVEGESLRDRLTRETRLPIPDAVRITSEIAGALDYAHRQGVVHRDIKPENILLHDGHAVIADFGIAIATGAGDTRLTETGLSVGTPSYMSPEQALGERNLDARSDVYAAGAVLYEMLTGTAPYTGATAQAVIAKVIAEKPQPPSRHRKEISARLDDAVLTALEKNPEDRFATAAAMGAAVAGEMPHDALRRSRRRLRARALVAVAAVGVIAVLLMRPWQPHGRAIARHVPDPAAALLVLRAEALIKGRTSGRCARAINWFSQATIIDSMYSDAWAGLGKAHALCALFADTDPTVPFTDAGGAVDHALRLDERNSDAYTTRGMVRLFHQQEFAAAEEAFSRATELDTSKYEPWLFRTQVYVAADRLDSAEISVRRAMQLHPVGDPIIGVRLATILEKEGKLREAQDELDQVRQLNPDVSFGPVEEEQLQVDFQAGRCDWAGSLQANGIRQIRDAALATYHVACNQRALALKYADSVDAVSRSDNYVDEFSLATVFAALGDTTRMFRALRAAVMQHNWALFQLRHSFVFRSYLDTPEFRRLIVAAHVK